MTGSTPEEILKRYFGYDSFREGQKKLIECILSGRDCLGIMPTGAGKSVCYQIPAMLMDGITIVVSPLISLMKDQVGALVQSGIPAAYINSSLSPAQSAKVLECARAGAYKLLYVAPERLDTYDFMSFASNMRVSMLTVDEAHCISQWGQDFRPSYTRIPEFVAGLRERPVLSAFTATATPRVRTDIIKQLRLLAPETLVTSFDRKNLYFEVRRPTNKFAELLGIIKNREDKSGIVYCSTRSTAEEVASKLCGAGISAACYHAGLSDEDRQKNQDDFIFDRVRVMAATNAFGMGIDKSNVSYVVHYNMPKDIESYYQEAGRAGRDGNEAECILLFSKQDIVTNRMLIDRSAASDCPDRQTEYLIRERNLRRLDAMAKYCTTSGCLRSYILEYFGETAAESCGKCGNCNADFTTVDMTVEAKKLLSCIYRMRVPCGAGTIIGVLTGKRTKKIRESGYDKLSTFGISNESAENLEQLIETLVNEKYLNRSDSRFETLSLNEKANDILYGSDKIEVRIKIDTKSEGSISDEIKFGKSPKSRANHVSSGQKASAAANADPELFKQLRSLRRELADEQHVPAFMIFADSTLTDMCMKRPQNNEQMLSVQGVGEVKLKKYGSRFLSVIAEYLKSIPTAASHEADRLFGNPYTNSNSTAGKQNAPSVTSYGTADKRNNSSPTASYGAANKRLDEPPMISNIAEIPPLPENPDIDPVDDEVAAAFERWREQEKINDWLPYSEEAEMSGIKLLADPPEADDTSNDNVMQANIELSDECVTAGVISNRLNKLCLHGKKLSVKTAAINSWLISTGMLEDIDKNGARYRQPTLRGKALGISVALGMTGDKLYSMILFDKKAQKYVSDHAEELDELS